MDRIADAIANLDIAQLVILIGAMWVFYSRLNGKIEKLDDKVADIDKRLFSVERMMHMKECCVIKDDSHLRKAE